MIFITNIVLYITTYMDQTCPDDDIMCFSFQSGNPLETICHVVIQDNAIFECSYVYLTQNKGVREVFKKVHVYV